MITGLAQAETKPNVIYILADDLGIGDLSCYGQLKLKTPNIDRLAKEGVQFTNHYSGNTVCSPTRAVIMTGQHPGNVHCRGNGEEDNFALDPKMTTMPRMFKKAGYATGAYGKWGLGTTSRNDKSNPLKHGFDHFTGWKSQRIAHTYYPNLIIRDGKEEPLEKGTFIHDLIMADAFQFIKTNAEKKKPFFCYIPTAVPHAAMHAPKEMHEKWRKVFPQFDNKIGKYGAGSEDKTPDVVNPIAGFAAMMENLDNQIGELIDMMGELGIDENTIILFSSDNGCHREGGHQPDFWDSNGPHRGIKRDLYEGGIRTPFLARWPGKIAPGSTSDHISAHWDLMPTFAELIGQPLPEQADGISMVSTLMGKADAQKKHEFLYFEFIKGKPKGPYSTRALRQRDWKVVQRSEKDGGEKFLEVELYDLSKDIGEQNNLSGQHPKIVSHLTKLMDGAHTPLP
ncbi:UNVERIFIED_CONTAM: hypothetical protein GTU68_056218 [Idotea baltica]|nr:hypothetical protein [Idotea baltica]